MDETASLVDEAIEAYKAGDKNGAVRLLTEALKRDPRNEQAWLYMGAALDDPDKRRQAFQRVLQINPNNERAKAALNRLGGTTTPPPPAGGTNAPTGKSAGATGKAAADAAAENLKRAQQQASAFATKAYAEGFAIPVTIAGAPSRVNGPYVVENARKWATEGFKFITTRDFEAYEAGTKNATNWDTVFIVGVCAALLAVAAFIGHLLGFIFKLFNHPTFGQFILIFTAPIVVVIAVALGFAASVYAVRYFLKSQFNMDPTLSEIGIAYAGIFLPMTIVQAGFDLISGIFGPFANFFNVLPILIALVMIFYAWFLLKDVFGRNYGNDNDRGMYTAAVLVVVYIAIFGLLRGVFRV
jgi:tetratricopeptide (TPR) repeat protein